MAHEPFAYIGAAIKAQQRYAVDVSDAGATHKSLSAQAQQCYLMNKCWLYKPLCLDGKLLKYTVINPNAAYPQTPENHLNVTYALKENGGKQY